MRKKLFVTLLAAGLAVPALAAEAPPAKVERVERGSLVIEGVPAIPAELNERLNRYQQTRSASFAGWLPDDSLLISTRFGETAQVHRVAKPLGARTQLSFHAEPVGAVTTHPKQQGFVYVVGHHHGRHAGLSADAQQLLLQVAAGERIEGAEGLIEQQ